MQLVIEAMTTSPSSSVQSSPATGCARRREFERLEFAAGVGERDPVLRPLRAGDGRDDVAEIELQRVGERRFGRIGVAPHALGFRIGFDQRDLPGIAAGEFEIAQGFGVDREEAAGRAVFRRHVGDRRLVGQAQSVEAGAEEFDELADHAAGAQHLGDGQYQIGCGRAFLERAGQLEADHLGNEHGDRLAEHRRLGLDAADAPAEHGEAVDHRRVAVGADAGIRIGDGFAVLRAGPHGLGQIFDIDLVADAGARRHDPEIVEGRRAPAQEFVTLAVCARIRARHSAGTRPACRNGRWSPSGRSPGRPGPAD